MKQVAVFMLGVASASACSSGIKRVEPPISVARSGIDGTKLASMLRDSVTNGGLWFDDAECAAKFQAPGEIKQEELAAFGHCLEGLKLQASDRKDSLLDVAVMHYAPGFEVQARIAEESAGPRLAWIGFAARHGHDEPPTITVEAFESLRLAGDRNGPPAPELASALVATPEGRRLEYTWLKVCLDTDGSVTSVRPHASTSVEATKAFEEAVTRWRFKPFLIAGQPVPVCALVRPTYPAAYASSPEFLPLPLPPPIGGKPPLVLAVEGRTFRTLKRVRGSNLITPSDDDKFRVQKAGNPRLMGSFQLCLDATGKAASVIPIYLTGLPGYDRKIQREMLQWAYEPLVVDGVPTSLCTSIIFIYTQR